MFQLLIAVMIPLCFTAPCDSLGLDANGRALLSPDPVAAYEFVQMDADGNSTVLRGYADSLGRETLTPHKPGTRQTVWLSLSPALLSKTIFVVSRDRNGNVSARSNGFTLDAPRYARLLESHPVGPTRLDVPVLARARERCGQAALEMVLRYYGADSVALRQAATAYDPARGRSQIGDLAAAARRAGYTVAVESLTPDALIGLLEDGVPPIVLYRAGDGTAPPGQYGVVTGWDPARAAFILNDGGAEPRVAPRQELATWWETAGSQALIVRRRSP